MKKMILLVCMLTSFVVTDRIICKEESTDIHITAQDIEISQPVKLIETYYHIPLSEDMQDNIMTIANENDIDRLTILAVIAVESDFDQNAVSESNDYGLMQINACNHANLMDKLELTDIMDPVDNVKAGSYMLGNLKEKYGSIDMALMAYNMGENGAKKLWNAGIYETDYTRKVNTAKTELEGKKYEVITILED